MIDQLELAIIEEWNKNKHGEAPENIKLEANIQDAKLVVVKSPADFRASYGPFAREIIFPDTPGPASSNLKRLDFTRVPRPLFPLDDI